ncbi:hypothetical protein KIPB_004499 [Kipferlia bialata]|uniref:Kelch repeat type 1 n=1 Tax=Kipferlia bialata TaxID=797122 RepID=A0A9K3GHI2_9EUKA|nr:hypothetical protein KIPB_004499 [Kipferlia bialata]|eukprot:g4499.t1
MEDSVSEGYDYDHYGLRDTLEDETLNVYLNDSTGRIAERELNLLVEDIGPEYDSMADVPGILDSDVRRGPVIDPSSVTLLGMTHPLVSGDLVSLGRGQAAWVGTVQNVQGDANRTAVVLYSFKSDGSFTERLLSNAPVSGDDSDLCTCIRGEELFVFGADRESHATSNDVSVFNIVTEEWRTLPHTGVWPQSMHSMESEVQGNMWYIRGSVQVEGEADSYEAPRLIYGFDMDTHMWTKPFPSGTMLLTSEPNPSSDRAIYFSWINQLVYSHTSQEGCRLLTKCPSEALVPGLVLDRHVVFYKRSITGQAAVYCYSLVSGVWYRSDSPLSGYPWRHCLIEPLTALVITYQPLPDDTTVVRPYLMQLYMPEEEDAVSH